MKKSIRTIYTFIWLFIYWLFFSNLAIAGPAVAPADKLALALTYEQREWLNTHPQIKIGAMDDWPPVNFINLDGKADGFGVALTELLNQRLGGRLKLVSGNWSEIYQAVKDKKLDAVFDITAKESRVPYFNFTKPYLKIPHVIIGRNTPPYYTTDSELAGKTIALEKGFGNVAYYRNNYPEIYIREYRNTAEALGAVARGEVDAYVGNRAVADYIIRRELLSSLKTHGRADKKGSVLSVGIRKDYSILADVLQLALNSISVPEFHAILAEVIEKQTALGNDRLTLRLEERAWLADHPVIRIAPNPYWPPFEYYDSYRKYQGISRDFLELLEKKLGVEFVVTQQDSWADVLKLLESHSVDVLPMAMKTKSRLHYADFTAPYVNNSMVIVTRNSVDFIPGMEGLKGQVVAVEEGYASHDIIQREQPAITLKAYKTTDLALRAVSRGQAFAYIGNMASVDYVIREKGLTNLRVSGDTEYRFQLSMAVRKDWPVLTHVLDKALASITAQERAEIFSRWIRIDTGDVFSWGRIIVAITFLLLVIIFISVWNYSLNKKVRERTRLLEFRAQHDELTQVSNRVALVSQLEQRIAHTERSEKPVFAVLFIDLDDFKKVNDTKGHSIGDQLLISVAERLKSSLQKADFICRFGGDEFVIVTDNVASPDDIEARCVDLLSAMQMPYQLGDISFKMTMSIGISCYPADGRTSDELLRNADIAMYSSKNSGRNCFNFFSEELNKDMNRRLLLENELIHALARDEITLVYQPIVNLNNEHTEKFEVLARWQNPKYGMISPQEFIPLAEHNGFIIALGEFILVSAIKTCVELNRKYSANYSISVNVSPVQLDDPSFGDKVLDLLEVYQLPPDNLILEITEGVLIHHSEASTKVLHRLTEKGVQLAMDDFGTGYSSLSYLRNYPFNILKIDKEFIQDIPGDKKDTELVETVLAMASRMGIEVIAEGVELKEQGEKLISIGCEKVQGFYFARPMCKELLMEWLSPDTSEEPQSSVAASVNYQKIIQPS